MIAPTSGKRSQWASMRWRATKKRGSGAHRAARRVRAASNASGHDAPCWTARSIDHSSEGAHTTKWTNADYALTHGPGAWNSGEIDQPNYVATNGGGSEFVLDTGRATGATAKGYERYRTAATDDRPPWPDGRLTINCFCHASDADEPWLLTFQLAHLSFLPNSHLLANQRSAVFACESYRLAAHT